MDKSIKTYSLPELASVMKELGQPAFRAQQLQEWLYQRHASSYDEMTNLPGSLRATLAERFPLTMPTVVDRQISKDGTRKYLVEFDDGIRVETVGIPSRNGDRLTVCFSTQAGCPIACAFCATGQEGFARNLTPGEIVDQVLIVQEDMGKRVTNAVGMGQGEPFLNYDNTMAASASQPAGFCLVWNASLRNPSNLPSRFRSMQRVNRFATSLCLMLLVTNCLR